MTKPASFNFSKALLAWFDQHGRKNLPWQHPISPYRVWLSEVMLQQTQVETVIPYFEAFIRRYPTIKKLAQAPLDDVLHLWTGLGYYARARNLHKCAQLVALEHKGKFPSEPEQLNALPGIGKSTAHAISSIAFGQPTAILDGNVKRVLSRFHAVEGWPGIPRVEKVLWLHAQTHMPKNRCADYTQAIMDLGATVCKRSNPACHQCPMQSYCKAFKSNKVKELPEKKPRKVNPTKSVVMLLARDHQGKILLEKRPERGIWGGLWSFLEFEQIEQALTHGGQLGKLVNHEKWAEFSHVFSHYTLNITPLIISIVKRPRTSEKDNTRWVTIEDALKLGLAAPVKRLIESAQQLPEKLI